MPKTVVLSALLVVGQHCVRFLNFLEPVLSVLFSASIGVVFSSEATERVLHVPAGCRLVDTQDFVVVSFVTHRAVLDVDDEGPDLNLTARFHRSRPQ